VSQEESPGVPRLRSGAGDAPAIDVVIPAYDEAAQIGGCLDGVLAQDHPAELVHIWVVDAGSTDDTAEVVAARARSEPRITLVRADGRLNAGQAMNVGVARGRAPLVARVDAHSRLAADYLSRAADAFARDGDRLACAGGQPEQVGETTVGRAVAIARGSRFGVGGSVYADRRAHADVDTVQCGVYSRRALEQAGGFASGMLTGEDEELHWRLRRAGYRILLDTRLRYRYTTRSTWRAAFRQYRNYGRSRARVLAVHPGFLRPWHLVPSALVASVAALTIAAPRSGSARRALACLVSGYAATASAAAVHAAGEELQLAPAIAASFPALHLGYGVGLLEGFVELVRGRLAGAGPPTAVERR
jgi:succinoglycan biosynthesis protein ExoA